MPVQEVTEEVEVAEAGAGSMSIEDALKQVLKVALIHDGLARGIREASKALDSKRAHLCILCESNTEESYKKLIEALCSEHNIPIIKVGDAKKLGEWAGLCQLNREGQAVKVVACSAVAIKDYGEESTGLQVLQEYVNSQKAA